MALQQRQGSKTANAKYQIGQISPLNALAPLELFQIDHTPVHVIVVDEQERLPACLLPTVRKRVNTSPKLQLRLQWRN